MIIIMAFLQTTGIYFKVIACIGALEHDTYCLLSTLQTVKTYCEQVPSEFESI